MKLLQVGMLKSFLLPILLLHSLVRPAAATASACDEWDLLQREIRDGTIVSDQAFGKIVELDGRLRKEYSEKIDDRPFSFPVKGYGPDCIGGSEGSGYQPEGYDFYDGNRHRGHPAHDLFINDPEETGFDASTDYPAEIVAFSSGVVVAVNRSWEYPSQVRGGIYIWIFSPADQRYCYYAHLARTLVAPGDVVKAGDPIGLLGRSGKNAWPKRSPTHLHFMCLSFDEGRMTPVNTYPELRQPGGD